MKILLLALLFLPLSACFEKAPKLQDNQLAIQTENGNVHIFNIETAITVEEQVKGLMHRTEIPENAGMLFYFGEEARRAFWMKNTLIFLDLLFIKADGTIHHIHEKAVPHDLTRIRSHGPVAAVLEVNGGITRKLDIKEGDKVQHSAFAPPNAQ